MSQQELTEEEEAELSFAESEGEREAEFGMSFVNSGGLSSDVAQAWREHRMTNEEFGEFQETLQREMHDVDCFCRACQ